MSLTIYLLSREYGAPVNDAAHGFVVRAKDAASAREIASAQAGDEGKEVWLDSKKVKIKAVGIATSSDRPGVILRDFNAA